MSTSTKSRTSSQGKSTFEHREDSGTLFYDAPGAPTLSGALRRGKTINVTAEPAVDRQTRDYIRISGNGVSGALYTNERKEQERHPDFTGPIEINGEKLRVSVWKKVTQTGKNAGSEFLSLALSARNPTE